MCSELLKIYLKGVWKLVSEPSSNLSTLIFLAPKSQEEGKEIAALPPILITVLAQICWSNVVSICTIFSRVENTINLLSALVCMIYLTSLLNEMILHSGNL